MEPASTSEIEQWLRQPFHLTDKGHVWLDEIERRFAEGESIEQIAAALRLEPWCIQLLFVMEAHDEDLPNERTQT